MFREITHCCSGNAMAFGGGFCFPGNLFLGVKPESQFSSFFSKKGDFLLKFELLNLNVFLVEFSLTGLPLRYFLSVNPVYFG